MARIRPLDPLPSPHYLRNLDLPEVLMGADRSALTLVDAPCEALALPDDDLLDALLRQHAR